MVSPLEDIDLMAGAAEVERGRHPGRTGADHGDRLPGGFRQLRMWSVGGLIAQPALNRTDRYRLLFGSDGEIAALFAEMWTDSPGDPGEGVAPREEVECFAYLALSDEV